MPSVFVSYRRNDSHTFADRIYDSLVNAFGEECVFQDVDDIPLGKDFREVLRNEIENCDVILIIIGSQWLDIKDDLGNRRLDSPEDFVRIEVETALAQNKIIIPVLVDFARMPGASDLPVSIRELAFRNAATIRHNPDFARDIGRLTTQIRNNEIFPIENSEVSQSFEDARPTQQAMSNLAEDFVAPPKPGSSYSTRYNAHFSTVINNQFSNIKNSIIGLVIIILIISVSGAILLISVATNPFSIDNSFSPTPKNINVFVTQTAQANQSATDVKLAQETEIQTPILEGTIVAINSPSRSPTLSLHSALTLSLATETPRSKLGGRSLFRIDSERSVVRFITHEELQGSPKTVIGVTDQIAGDIIVNFDDPANSQVGEIRINARTLETDSEFRDRALRSEILESANADYEFVSFVPTAISGLPDSISIGQEISFEVTGDFTVRNITNSVTFEISASLVTEERIDGTGTTQVTRDMYNLTIPEAPGVANVSNEIDLEIEFVARLVEES